MNIKKAWKTVALVVGVSALLLLIIIQAILSGVLNSKLEDELTKQTGCKTTIGTCRVSLLPSLKVHIAGLTMENPQGEWLHDTLLSIGECKAKVSLLPLLTGKVKVRSFLLKESFLNYEVSPKGTSNIEQIVANNAEVEKKEKKESNLQLSLSDFWIEDVSLFYDNRETGERYACRDLRQLLSLTFNAKTGELETRGRLSLSNLYVKSAGQPTLLDGVTLSLEHDLQANIKENSYTITRVSAALNDIALTLKGTVADTTLDLHLSTETIKLADVLKQIPKNLSPELAKLSAGGTFKLDVTAKGKVTKPQIKGKLDIAQGMLKHSDLTDSIHAITAKTSFTENSLTIADLGLKIGNDPIHIKGTFTDFANPYIDATIKANLAMASLKGAWKIPEGYALTGRIISDIAAKGRYNPTKPTDLSVSGGVQFQQFSFLTPEVAKSIKVNGAISISPEVIHQNLAVKLGSSDATFNGSVRHWQKFITMKRMGKGPRPVITLTMHSKSLNLDSLLVKKEKEITKTEESETTTAEPAEKGAVKKILPEPLPPLNFSLNFSADTLIHEGLSIRGIKSNASLKNDIIKLSLDCDLFGGHIYSRQLLNAQRETLKLSSTLNITNIDANKLVSHYNDQLVKTKKLFLMIRGFDNYIYGQMSLRTNFKSHGVTNEDLQSNIEGQLTGTLTRGYFMGGSLTKALDARLSKFYSIDEVHFKTLETSLRIKDEKVFFDTLTMDAKRLGEWKAYGSVGFDASLDFNLENRLPLKVSQKITGVTDKIKSSATSKIKEKIDGPLGSLAAAVVDKQGIPTDDEGRVTVTLGIKGEASDPSVSTVGFKKVERTTPKEKPVVTQNKEKLKRELLKERKKLEKKAQKELIKQLEKKRGKKLSRKEKKALKKKLPKDIKKLFK